MERPTNEAIVAVAKMLMAAVRTPAMIVGAASGSSTRRMTSHASHAHPLGGLNGGGVDLAHGDEGVRQDRRQPQDPQGEGDVAEADADQGGQQEDDGDLGDGPPRVAEAHGEVLPLADVPEDEADRHADGQRTAERDRAHLQLRAGKGPDVGDSADLARRPPVTASRGVKDEVECAGERIDDARDEDHRDLARRHGIRKRWPRTTIRSSASAIPIVSTPTMMMLVLKSGCA